MSNSDFDAALGRVPSGIFILTAGTGDRATGMLTSWVMQAGFDPPTVSVALNLSRHVCDWITSGEPFVLNIVTENQVELLKHFGKGFDPDEAAFEGLSIRHCARGVPVLEDCLGHLECEPTEHVDSGDHRVFLARVVRGALANDASPMIHVRKSGRGY